MDCEAPKVRLRLIRYEAHLETCSWAATCHPDLHARRMFCGSRFGSRLGHRRYVGLLAADFFTAKGAVESLSRACGRNPGGMCRLAERLEHVAPQTREEFVQVTAAAAQRLGVEEVARTARPAPAQPAQALAPISPMARGQDR